MGTKKLNNLIQCNLQVLKFMVDSDTKCHESLRSGVDLSLPVSSGMSYQSGKFRGGINWTVFYYQAGYLTAVPFFSIMLDNVNQVLF
jgi:hypothetical protein